MPQDEDRVFDVSKPKRTGPSPNSRPIIVGHHPQAADPMVNERPMEHQSLEPTTSSDAKPTHVSIAVQSATKDKLPSEELESVPSGPAEMPLMEHHTMEGHQPSVVPPMPLAVPTESAPPPAPTPAPEPVPEAKEPVANEHAESVFPEAAQASAGSQEEAKISADQAANPSLAPQAAVPLPPVIAPDPALDDLPLPHHAGHNGHSHGGHQPETTPHNKGDKGKMLWLLAIIVLLAAAYAALDATTSAMPFHIFKKTKVAVVQVSTPPPATSTPAAPASSTPSGYTNYVLAGTAVSFDSPTAWGAPVVTKEPGYSKRSTSATSDGTYAQIINFATNKDVQMVLTSSKYLPAARATLYYDYLQWCVGTNDGNFYKSLLHFTSASGVDTPSTITCDQGPLSDATKVDATTIVQLKTKNPDNSVLGDLYTKNLNYAVLPVLRVKDAVMTNSDAIKVLLGSVKVSSSGAASSSQ